LVQLVLEVNCRDFMDHRVRSFNIRFSSPRRRLCIS